MPDGPNREEKKEVLSQTQGFGMVPVYQERRDGSRIVTGYRFDEQTAARQGIVPTPKPAAILAEQERLGGKEIEPVYAQGTISRGRGGSETVNYGPPIGYRYDNGKSEYVNFTPSGEYQGTQKRQSTFEQLAPFLAIAAMPFVGPALFEALGLTAGTAGGAGLLGAEGATAALGAGQVSSLGGAGLLGAEGTAATLAGMGGGTGLTAALGADLAAGGALTAGGAGAAGMGGAAGLTALSSLSPIAAAPLAAAGTGLAAMGGGAGLTAAGAGGGTVGAGLLDGTAALGTGGGLTTGGAGASGMGGGTGLSATLGTDLAGGGALTAGDAGLASMGGGTGLTALSNIGASAGAPLAAAGTGLASMGGGTGLTTAAAGGGTVGAGGVTPAGGSLIGSDSVISGGTGTPAATASSLPSLSTVKDALTVASLVAGAAGNSGTSTAAPFTMAPYVPPSGKPFANIAMSPIAAPYTPTRILGQYDPTMTPGGVSPYELIMQQMQAPQNLYADFEAGTNIGGFDPQRFVVPPAAAAAALPNNMGGMIDKSRMVGPDPMGPDNGFASIQDGEFVMNRKVTAKYGIELMNAINSGKISKGKLSGLLEA